MSIPSALPGLNFVPRDVLRAMEKIHNAGFDVWLVGGALRDYLLGEVPKDWDLATSASPEDIMEIFPRVIPVGIRHGTVQVHTRLRDIEVTSFTPPGMEGIIKDLGRRDFTINAMALSYPEGELVDPYDGRADLDEGLIRGVEDPRARFAEDPLRIVRAGRLSGVYGFAVHPKTFEAIREEAESVDQVSGERIREEFLKILQSPYCVEAFDLLRKSWALGKLLPEIVMRDHVHTLPGSGMSIYRHTMLCVKNCPVRLRVRTAALFLNVGVPAAGARGEKLPVEFAKQSAAAAVARMKKWKMSNRQMEDISSLVENQLPPGAEVWSDAALRGFLSRVRHELADDFIDLAVAERLARGVTDTAGLTILRERMREQLAAAPALKIGDLAVSGADVMEALGFSQGPKVGKVLKGLLEMVIQDPGLNERERLLEIVSREFGSERSGS